MLLNEPKLIFYKNLTLSNDKIGCFNIVYLFDKMHYRSG